MLEPYQKIVEREADLVRRVKFVLDGGHTQRFHTKRTLLVDTVGHHSYDVAWLCHFMSEHLCLGERYDLQMAALAHDTPEQEVGDMPAPAKRDMGIRDIFSDNERDILAQHEVDFETSLSEEAQRILKLADACDGAFFCIRERSLGNMTMKGCFDNFVQYASEKINKAHFEEMVIFGMLLSEWEKVNG
jgi:5'-deoxynucleotidase YfbR-like HD superfamily hydrolase